MSTHQKMRIGLVGPCAAGKTTLAKGLESRGYEVRQIAQEHSYVPDMWRQISQPDVLIYLDVSHPVSIERRPQNFNQKEMDIQVDRLKHARINADFYLDTNQLSIVEVLEKVLLFLAEGEIRPV